MNCIDCEYYVGYAVESDGRSCCKWGGMECLYREHNYKGERK